VAQGAPWLFSVSLEGGSGAGCVWRAYGPIAAVRWRNALACPNVLPIARGKSLVNYASGLLALEFGLAFWCDMKPPAWLGIWALVYLVVANRWIGHAEIVEWIENESIMGP